MNDYQRVQALPGWADTIKPYSEAFQKGILFVLAHENEYHPDGTVATEFDPHDPGGTTRYGIDQASHPHLDIENLTLEEAVQSYHDDEWQHAQGELGDHARMPMSLMICHFDSVVNIGTVPSNKILQEAVGAFPDGKIGSRTIEAIGKSDPKIASEHMLDLRKTYYTHLRQFPRYGKGWLARVDDLRQFISAC